MTDQTIPADKVRPILDEWERIKEYADWENMDNLVQDVRALLPTPPLPTLADMTDEERDACQWMQADVKGDDSRAVIVNPYWVGAIARVMWPDTHMGSVTWERITPRPDLPRMEWPGTGQDGEEATKVDYVPVAGGRTAYGPWTVARLRKKADAADAVPESTLAVGSVWRNMDALTRACEETGRDQIVVLDHPGDAHIWSGAVEQWEVMAPLSVNGPFTIIHDGKKADQ